MTNHRAFGRFSVDLDHIEHRPALARQILKDLIVVRAETMFHKHAIEYVAFGEPFRPIAPGEDAPYYTVEIRDLVGGKYLVTFQEVKGL